MHASSPSPAVYTNAQSGGVDQFRLNASVTSEPRKTDSWGEWTEWTRCSRDCGGGRQSRMRECLFENKARINCSGDRVQIQECNIHECPGEKLVSVVFECCYVCVRVCGICSGWWLDQMV